MAGNRLVITTTLLSSCMAAAALRLTFGSLMRTSLHSRRTYKDNYHVCKTSDCGGTYLKDRLVRGCNTNSCSYDVYFIGNTDFYGKDLTIHTCKEFAIISQLHEDRLLHFSFQDGKRIVTPPPQVE